MTPVTGDLERLKRWIASRKLMHLIQIANDLHFPLDTIHIFNKALM